MSIEKLKQKHREVIVKIPVNVRSNLQQAFLSTIRQSAEALSTRLFFPAPNKDDDNQPKEPKRVPKEEPNLTVRATNSTQAPYKQEPAPYAPSPSPYLSPNLTHTPPPTPPPTPVGINERIT